MKNRFFFLVLALDVVLRQAGECIQMPLKPPYLSAIVSNANLMENRRQQRINISGDVILGGLFSIHRSDFGQACQQWSNLMNIERVEAMLYAIDKVRMRCMLSLVVY